MRSGRGFVSRYVDQGPEAVLGAVWYDAESATTGPDDVSALVRSKMRAEVEGKLARTRRSPLRVVLDFLNSMSDWRD